MIRLYFSTSYRGVDMKKYTFGKKVDLVELSDVFRRHAGFDDQDTAKKLVKATRRVACLSTWYMPEYGQKFGHNKSVDEEITKEIKRMVKLAEKLKIKEIVLPFEKHEDSWIAKRIQKKVLDNLSLPVTVRLRTGSYRRDNVEFGRIDKRIKTALDKGVRGVTGISPAITEIWDRPTFNPW